MSEYSGVVWAYILEANIPSRLIVGDNALLWRALCYVARVLALRRSFTGAINEAFGLFYTRYLIYFAHSRAGLAT
ncbi:hypothetical protein PISMIDRAFT_674607 [Pisolithus microcarpus 441]|uniref:Uncharacterized protein n=1 Tax=Pisolithus microcarpus 441 TaxID=765257 RepID=A0A0C9ZNU7_9AGAM|nr:hypothetical protein PISMIDRAFT_674607 [Pisolithus microcarpus 441]